MAGAGGVPGLAQLLVPTAAVREAEDVGLWPVQGVERMVLLHGRVERGGRGAQVVVQRRQTLGAVPLPGHPELQRVAAARALEAAHALVVDTVRAVVEQVLG